MVHCQKLAPTGAGSADRGTRRREAAALLDRLRALLLAAKPTSDDPDDDGSSGLLAARLNSVNKTETATWRPPLAVVASTFRWSETIFMVGMTGFEPATLRSQRP